MGIFKRSLWQIKLTLQGNTLKYYRKLERYQWFSSEETKALQQEKLRCLLEHAYQNVPYYRDILRQSGVVNDKGEVNLDYYSSIPFLDKSIIRANFENLQSKDLNTRNWFENTSGGSTGEPVRFIQDKDYTDWNQAVKILDDTWSGYSLSEKKARLWGSERDLFVGKQTVKTTISRYLKNEIWLNSLHMTPVAMENYVKEINKFKPVQILAYAKSIYELARYIDNNEIPVYSPKAIMTSATTLYPDMRETIERVFGTSVFNRYGSREVGDVACECDHHKGLHVSIPTHYIEILTPDGKPAEPGESGEIVVTSLTNYSMPLIRYRIGDMGVWSEEKCSCGRSWPLLKEIRGRITDIFLTRDGTQIYGGYFTRLLLNRNWVEKFQVVQEDYEKINISIKLHLATNDPFNIYSEEIKDIKDRVRKVMGEKCRVTVKFVNDIPPSPSGKYRYTISKVVR